MQLSASVAWIVKLYAPIALGVPEISPFEEVSDKPEGRLPALTLNVYGLVPPLAQTFVL